MFKLGEYNEDDSKIIASYLKNAGLRVDVRPSITASAYSIAFMEGRLSELRGKVDDMERYERYLEALKRALSSGPTPENFKDRFFIELDPSWRLMQRLMDQRPLTEPLEAEMEEEAEEGKLSDIVDKLGEWMEAFEFIEVTLSLNDIEIGQPVGEKINDPLLRIEVDPEDYSQDEKLLRRSVQVDLEKVYDVTIDEFSALLFSDIDEDFEEDYPEEYIQIMAFGLLIDDLIDKPSQGKLDLQSFTKLCLLELGKEEKDASIIINGTDVAEEIARVLEENGIVKVKGDTIKWKI